MIGPVLVTPATVTPVSLNEAKLHLRVAFPDDEGNVPASDEDAIIQAFIDAAVSYLDGPQGILGRCLVEQTWRADFSGFEQRLCLPFGPVISVVSVTWRNADGQIATVDDDNYLLQADAGGNTYLVFRSGYNFPSSLAEFDPIAVTFKAGYPLVDEKPTTPSALKVAILLLVGTWFENRDATVATTINELPFAVNALISPFRRINL